MEGGYEIRGSLFDEIQYTMLDEILIVVVYP